MADATPSSTPPRGPTATSMQMDFFEHQDQARRSTTRLVVLFILGVLGLTAAVYGLVVVCFLAGESKSRSIESGVLATHPLTIIGVVGITWLVIGGGSLYKIAQLRGGGRVVAEHLGGRPILSSTRDPDERRVLNVVEEMAIASGTPCPTVYLMKSENAINAFAAGFSPEDAVIGITRGAVRQLTRDELQGVVAHEFSHILNGDMRLNIRLIGVLHGLLILGMLGYYLMRISPYSSRRNREAAGIALFGMGLMAVGFVGTGIGTLIKASISRQREYLADAAAVQFTRNPNGIGDALRRIGGHGRGATLQSPNALEASHLLFENGVTSQLTAMLSTHPPLEKRIRAILPQWDGTMLTTQPQVSEPDGADDATSEDDRRRMMREILLTGTIATGSTLAARSVPSIGRPTPAHVERARALIASIPNDLRNASTDPFDAAGLICAMLIDRDDARIQTKQFDAIVEHGPRGLDASTRRLVPSIHALDETARLPLLERTIAALRELSPAQYVQLRTVMDALVRADHRLELFEWTLQRIVVQYLDPHFGAQSTERARHLQIHTVADEAATLLSLLAYIGHDKHDDVSAAFFIGAQTAKLKEATLCPRSGCSLDRMGAVLDTLRTATPRVKRDLITACAACIGADDQVTVREAELLRAICDSLGCPMPPILPDAPSD